MEIDDIDLDGLEGSFYDKIPDQIPPQKITLLEKEIIKAKNVNFMGITSEFLKDPDGKKKGQKEGGKRKTWKAQ